jgi:hypothetical protein
MKLSDLLVDDWRHAWRWSSVRLHAAVTLLAGVYALMPTLDPTLAAMLPLPLQARAIGAYAVVGLLLRVTQLKKPNG